MVTFLRLWYFSACGGAEGMTLLERISSKNLKYFSCHWRSLPPSFLISVDVWRQVRQHMRPEKLKFDKDRHLLTWDLCERQEQGGTRVGTAQCRLDLKRADPRNTTNEINCSVKSEDFIHFLGMIEERKRWRGQTTCNTCRIDTMLLPGQCILICTTELFSTLKLQTELWSLPNRRVLCHRDVAGLCLFACHHCKFCWGLCTVGYSFKHFPLNGSFLNIRNRKQAALSTVLNEQWQGFLWIPDFLYSPTFHPKTELQWNTVSLILYTEIAWWRIMFASQFPFAICIFKLIFSCKFLSLQAAGLSGCCLFYTVHLYYVLSWFTMASKSSGRVCRVLFIQWITTKSTFVLDYSQQVTSVPNFPWLISPVPARWCQHSYPACWCQWVIPVWLSNTPALPGFSGECVCF